MHGKVSITQFNAPAGDTFQAISLAGGHVISIKTYLMATCINNSHRYFCAQMYYADLILVHVLVAHKPIKIW